MKRILFYSQHLAGMGHLMRSTEIMRSLAQQFELCFVHGGQAVPGFSLPGGISEIRLPGLLMEGPQLKVVDETQSLESLQAQRKALLRQALEAFRPHCLITEGFPFSKHTLRFELIPLLEHIEVAGYSTKIVCCLRDIIMTQAMADGVRAKKQARTCKWINRYYDLVLYHCDPKFLRLEEVFPSCKELNPEVFYTGFVTQTEGGAHPLNSEDAQALSQPGPSMVVSVGGGRHGYELLRAISTIAPQLHTTIPHHIYGFAGPYLPEGQFQELQTLAMANPNLTLRRFTPRLMDYLDRADLSISLGGYNTTMNILKTGVRSLIYPSPSEDQSGEQTLRARRLESLGILQVLTQADLAPEALTQKILTMLNRPSKAHPFHLDGAQQSALKLQAFLNQPQRGIVLQNQVREVITPGLKPARNLLTL